MAKEYVEQRAGIYYVAGTRVSLDSIVYAFRRGESPETIRQNFEVLQLEEVYGAITYYLANRVELDDYLGQQRNKCEELRRASDPLPIRKLARKMAGPVAEAIAAEEIWWFEEST